MNPQNDFLPRLSDTMRRALATLFNSLPSHVSRHFTPGALCALVLLTEKCAGVRWNTLSALKARVLEYLGADEERTALVRLAKGALDAEDESAGSVLDWFDSDALSEALALSLLDTIEADAPDISEAASDALDACDLTPVLSFMSDHAIKQKQDGEELAYLVQDVLEYHTGSRYSEERWSDYIKLVGPERVVSIIVYESCHIELYCESRETACCISQSAWYVEQGEMWATSYTVDLCDVKVPSDEWTYLDVYGVYDCEFTADAVREINYNLTVEEAPFAIKHYARERYRELWDKVENEDAFIEWVIDQVLHTDNYPNCRDRLECDSWHLQFFPDWSNSLSYSDVIYEAFNHFNITEEETSEGVYLVPGVCVTLHDFPEESRSDLLACYHTGDCEASCAAFLDKWAHLIDGEPDTLLALAEERGLYDYGHERPDNVDPLWVKSWIIWLMAGDFQASGDGVSYWDC